MNDINAVTLTGRLTKDAELKYTPGGLAIAELSLAVNERRKKGDEWVDEASFFDVTLFGRSAEALQQYLVKGKQIGVEGKLNQDRWQDKETGQNRSKVKILARDITLMGSKGDTQEQRPKTYMAPVEEIDPGVGQNEFSDALPF